MNPSLIGQPVSAQAPFPVNVRRLVGDIAQTFNPLGRDFALDYHVSKAQNGLVVVSVALPEGMTRAYMTLLESLTGFVRVIDNKAQGSFREVRVQSPSAISEAKRLQEAFTADICHRFDVLIGAGVPRNDAIKCVNDALKAEKHPWAGYDLVRSTLSAAGKLRRPKTGHGEKRRKAVQPGPDL
ncbi:MAG: hypothetical protein AB7F21_07715 [Desulfuromonadales bacterium]